MNEYGQMAQQHWRRWLPQRYSQIEDPNSYFSTLGQTVATRIADLTLDLAEEDQPAGGDFMANLGRLNNAQQRAREMVLAQMVLLEPEAQTAELEDDEPESDPPEQPWVSIREDPNDPWWQQAMIDERLRQVD